MFGLLQVRVGIKCLAYLSYELESGVWPTSVKSWNQVIALFGNYIKNKY